MEGLSYQSETKRAARDRLWRRSVNSLTTERASTALPRDYVEQLRNMFIASPGSNAEEASRLSSSATATWSSFHDAHTQKKEPAHLKVLYLAGPEPQNDALVLLITLLSCAPWSERGIALVVSLLPLARTLEARPLSLSPRFHFFSFFSNRNNIFTFSV